MCDLDFFNVIHIQFGTKEAIQRRFDKFYDWNLSGGRSKKRSVSSWLYFKKVTILFTNKCFVCKNFVIVLDIINTNFGSVQILFFLFVFFTYYTDITNITNITFFLFLQKQEFTKINKKKREFNTLFSRISNKYLHYKLKLLAEKKYDVKKQKRNVFFLWRITKKVQKVMKLREKLKKKIRIEIILNEH